MLKMNIKLAAMTILTSVVGTACASTSVTKTSQSAPITYKIGQGEAQYASLDYTDRQKGVSRPHSYQPLGGQGSEFDTSKVDRNLYSHQKVGKRYTIMGQSYTPKHDPDYNKVGEASWYGPKFHGKPTANGETFNKNAMTAAHKTLPLNSMVRVTNLENGRTITVRLNDRGPFIGNRIIDMSEAAASALGFKSQGLANVRVRYVGPANPSAGTRILPKAAPKLAELPLENLTPAPRQAFPSLPSLPQYQSPAIPAPVPTPAPVPAAPRYSAPAIPAPISPSQPRRTPSDDLPSGGDITMTIKGPIHIARSTDEHIEPKFITGPLKTK